MHSPIEYTQAFVDFRAAFSQVWTSHDELAMEEGSHRIFGGNMGPHSLLNRHQNGLRTLDINTGAPVRLGMMSVIFCVSLLAVSFPTLSKRVKYLQIPRAVFFIGKHFGTGVILSTAFVHLLQDAFECLQDPDVKKSTNIGSWTGFIVLGSLLIIFVIEYISTSFVDRYHSYPSAPPSPKLEPASLTLTPEIAPPERTTSYNSEVTIKAFQPPLENTPLLGPSSSRPTASSRAYSQPTSGVHGQGHVHVHDHTILEGHHRHEQRCAHGEHHERPPRDTMNVLDDGLTRTRSHSFSNGHAHTHVDPESISEAEEDEGENEMAVGRKRQIVGILVLQLGIMIHSLVIGLTLAIASGTDFTSLVTAIVFHQLFEGLSLGIRIAGLPAPDSSAPHQMSLLKPILASLFAVTTPVGILIGLASFGVGSSSEEVRLKLIEGIMSAISAGMLIYAACVEMLAGDFVLDPTLWRSGIGRQAVALISLLAGVMAMAVIGLIH